MGGGGGLLFYLGRWQEAVKICFLNILDSSTR